MQFGAGKDAARGTNIERRGVPELPGTAGRSLVWLVADLPGRVEHLPRRQASQETWRWPRVREAVWFRPGRLPPLRRGAWRTAPGPGASGAMFAGRSPAGERPAADCRACAPGRAA